MLRLALLFGLCGCYHPSIQDGSIFCSDDGKCPSGFRCASDGLCYKNPPVLTPYGKGSLGSMTPSGTTMVLNSDTGAITVDGNSLVPASSSTFGVGQNGGPGVAIWSFTDLTIPAGMTVVASPDSRNIPVLAATMSMTVKGVIDVAGAGGGNGGPRANGVSRYANGSSNGDGGGGLTMGGGGGGGGGHAMAGSAGMGSNPGAGGPAYGAADLPAYFGAGGGGGSGSGSDDLPGAGGTGGGAIVLLAKTVVIDGVVRADGLDGRRAAGGNAGGGGGGAGGTILVSGDTVTVGAGAMLTALGRKGGAAAGSGGKGGDGADGVIRLFGSVTNSGAAMPAAAAPGAALTVFPK